MNKTVRRISAAMVAFGSASALVLLGTTPAYAGTAHGKSCGEAHPMDPSYYDAFGNAAPCTADFSSPNAGTARITIQVIQDPGATRKDPHRWSLDLSDCAGTVMPGDPPRTFTCPYGPGPHTVYVDKALGDKIVALTVDY